LHRIVKRIPSLDSLAVQAGNGARADREASIRTNYSRQANAAPKATLVNAKPLNGTSADFLGLLG
jgi:hypothetical protein